MQLPPALRLRRPDSHKGDFGHIFILAGSVRFSGAAVLCSEGALRSGCGLVTLGIPKGLNNAIIKIKPKEVMTLPLPQTKQIALSLKALGKIADFVKGIDIVAIGPGLGRDSSTQDLVRRLIAKLGRPLVIDADGLNALAGHLEKLKIKNSKLKIILTPHPGEMSKLTGFSIKDIQRNREDAALDFSKKYKLVVVLKGHHTVVADERGKLYINKTGNPGMATAGCGDVLTGMIASFLGQGLKPFEAAKYAVYLHGLAGDLALKEKGQLSIIASDIIGKIPEAIKISN